MIGVVDGTTRVSSSSTDGGTRRRRRRAVREDRAGFCHHSNQLFGAMVQPFRKVLDRYPLFEEALRTLSAVGDGVASRGNVN
jgi:hypothetical protein